MSTFLLFIGLVLVIPGLALMWHFFVRWLNTPDHAVLSSEDVAEGLEIAEDLGFWRGRLGDPEVGPIEKDTAESMVAYLEPIAIELREKADAKRILAEGKTLLPEEPPKTRGYKPPSGCWWIEDRKGNRVNPVIEEDFRRTLDKVESKYRRDSNIVDAPRSQESIDNHRAIKEAQVYHEQSVVAPEDEQAYLGAIGGWSRKPLSSGGHAAQGRPTNQIPKVAPRPAAGTAAAGSWWQQCHHCGGSGVISVYHTQQECQRCHGFGRHVPMYVCSTCQYTSDVRSEFGAEDPLLSGEPTFYCQPVHHGITPYKATIRPLFED